MLSNKLKMADHIPELSQDLVDYIILECANSCEQKRHISALVQIMKEIEDKFNEPILAWYSSVFRFYRKYANALNEAEQLKSGLKEQYLILDVIAAFLQDQSKTPNHSRIELLKQLLMKLNKYEAVEQDKRFSEIGLEARKVIFNGLYLSLQEMVVAHAKYRLSESKKVHQMSFRI